MKDFVSQVKRFAFGTDNANENGFVRAVRFIAIAAAIGGLDALSKVVTGISLPDPAITVPALTGLIAGAEKYLRNQQAKQVVSAGTGAPK